MMCQKRRQPEDRNIVKMIIKKRTALCLQTWWSGLKVRKRLIALQNIRSHLLKINSNTLYLEQTIYQNINYVVQEANTKLKFQ